MRDDKERLLDIKEAVERIKKYSGCGREAFEKDELIQNWIIHHLQIIGEAAARISEDFQSRNPQVPWSEIIGMRNVLVHDYFGVDFDVVWNVVERDMPELEVRICELLN
jgi:uncharacterized protein with HEPN domain